MFKKWTATISAASLLLFGASPAAFANTDDAIPTVDVSDESSAEQEITTGEEGTTEEEVTENEESSSEEGTEEEAMEDENTEEVEEPSLLPGYFFYFVKKMAENVRLAVTFDEYEEAKILADIAATRIAEANALFAAGEDELAQKTLEEALMAQEAAMKKSGEAESSEETEEGAEGDDSAEETTEAEGATEEKGTENEESSEEDELQVKLSQNIDALLGALVKVPNPNAQAALMKNVQKAFEKLDHKIAKLEVKNSEGLGQEEEAGEEVEVLVEEESEEKVAKSEDQAGKTEEQTKKRVEKAEEKSGKAQEKHVEAKKNDEKTKKNQGEANKERVKPTKDRDSVKNGQKDKEQGNKGNDKESGKDNGKGNGRN